MGARTPHLAIQSCLPGRSSSPLSWMDDLPSTDSCQWVLGVAVSECVAQSSLASSLALRSECVAESSLTHDHLIFRVAEYDMDNLTGRD